MSSKFEYNPPTSDPHIPDVRNCGCAACRECDALRAEIERLRAVLEKWRPGIRRAVNWYSRQGDVQRAEAFAAMLADFDTTLDR